MLVLGASIAVVEAFDTASFWRGHAPARITSCALLGVMATFLVKQPPTAADRNHPLKRS